MFVKTIVVGDNCRQKVNTYAKFRYFVDDITNVFLFIDIRNADN